MIPQFIKYLIYGIFVILLYQVLSILPVIRKLLISLIYIFRKVNNFISTKGLNLRFKLRHNYLKS